MQAEYVMKVQVINSQRRQPRFLSIFPPPLAAALDLAAGEQVQCEVIEMMKAIISDLMKRIPGKASEEWPMGEPFVQAFCAWFDVG